MARVMVHTVPTMILQEHCRKNISLGAGTRFCVINLRNDHVFYADNYQLFTKCLFGCVLHRGTVHPLRPEACVFPHLPTLTATVLDAFCCIYYLGLPPSQPLPPILSLCPLTDDLVLHLLPLPLVCYCCCCVVVAVAVVHAASLTRYPSSSPLPNQQEWMHRPSSAESSVRWTLTRPRPRSDASSNSSSRHRARSKRTSPPPRQLRHVLRHARQGPSPPAENGLSLRLPRLRVPRMTAARSQPPKGPVSRRMRKPALGYTSILPLVLPPLAIVFALTLTLTSSHPRADPAVKPKRTTDLPPSPRQPPSPSLTPRRRQTTPRSPSRTRT